jgi:hypothetical protein
LKGEEINEKALIASALNIETGGFGAALGLGS